MPRTGGPLSPANAWYPIARERVVPYAANGWYIIAREMTRQALITARRTGGGRSSTSRTSATSSGGQGGAGTGVMWPVSEQVMTATGHGIAGWRRTAGDQRGRARRGRSTR